ncbi:MAG: hypothetical protein JO253_03320 [Alphaproteobacteria bacterium]|nr:hypothetical protein [Alphaproteobacteria bacterium]
MQLSTQDLRENAQAYPVTTVELPRDTFMDGVFDAFAEIAKKVKIWHLRRIVKYAERTIATLPAERAATEISMQQRLARDMRIMNHNADLLMREAEHAASESRIALQELGVKP